MIKRIILILLVVCVIQGRHQHLRHTRQHQHQLTMKPGESCLPSTDLGGQKKEETYANQARKHLTQAADYLTEENRKAEDKQPFPNIYTYQDQNCVGNGQDPSKRDRRMRRS